MKNLSTFVISATIMVCCFLFSCNKMEDLLIPSSDEISTLKSTSHQGGAVFTVSPSGNYDDDSYAIQTALNAAVAAGAGSTVQLTAGTFYLNMGIEVDGFDGFFRGAGKGKTIIKTHGVVNIPGSDCYDLQSLITFRHGNINISDMTIQISDPNPCTGAYEWWNNALPCVIMITGKSCENPEATDQAASSTFKNIKFVGGVGSLNNYNVGYFIYIGFDWGTFYPLNGISKITNCEFQSAGVCIGTRYTNGPCIIGGDGSSGNKFEDTNLALLISDINNSYCNVSYNHFTKIYFASITLWQGYSIYNLSPSKFLVHGNDIELNSRTNEQSWAGLWVLDFDISPEAKLPKLDLNISSNRINLNNAAFAGIFGEYAINAVVTNNTIWGEGLSGIMTGIWGEDAYGWILKGNNLQGVNTLEGGAPIWLGESSSNCLVVGGSNKTNVLDEGTGNILTGVDLLHGNPPGPEIKDAMARRSEIMKLIKLPEMN